MRLIARFLDADDQVLAWCEFEARMPGDGTLRTVTSQIIAAGERDGACVVTHIHWPDLHVQRRIPMNPPLPIQVGMMVHLEFLHNEVFRFDNPQDHPPIPAVTVRRNITVNPQTLALGMKDSRIVK